MKPRVFVGSSVEGLSVAYAIQQNLANDAETTVWDQGVFELSKTTIESLSNVLDTSDFGIFVFSPDDVKFIREKESLSIRDNVLFELGLFIGKLSRDRVFFIVPEKSDLQIPTDLLGVTPGKYDPDRQDKSLQAATGPACNQMRKQIKRLGSLNPEQEPQAETAGIAVEKADDSKFEWLTDFFNKNYEDAKVKLEKVKAEQSGDELLRHEVWLSFINFKINDKNGLKEFLALAEKHPDNLTVQSQLSRLLLMENYIDKAIDVLTESLKHIPDNSSLILVLAECHKRNGDVDIATDLLSRHDPSNDPNISVALSRLYQDNGNLISAINIVHSSYVNFPSNESVMYRYANLLMESKRTKEALYLLNLLKSSYPENVEYWGYFSNCCLDLDLYDNAMVACKKAKELSQGKQSWILHNIGNLLKNKGFYTEAIEWLQKGSEIDTSSEYGHNRLAEAIKSKQEENDKLKNILKEGHKLIRTYSIEPGEEAH